ncbi:MAG TPA: DUF1579 domain-containing protein [Fimbriimonadaceae bacterium]|nr:DUF1579 domain-containing protein [Fimbriimonadaceae bacterium]HRJ97645.1 DUF1579 domain-containing protein [Fimbriimonadaceae bacterium]
MSETQEMEMGTKPTEQHAWLQQLVGEWRTESEMQMGPDGPTHTASGRERVVSLGGLWAFGEGEAMMPNGQPMNYKIALGWDVSFKEYRGCWIADVSSALWTYTGKLSDDGKTMTLDCVGPHMMKDGETANYRDVIEIIDANRRRLTSYGQDDDGNWIQFQKVEFYRM